MYCSLPVSCLHGILKAKILEWVAFPSPGDIPEPGIEPKSPVSPALHCRQILSCYWGSPRLRGNALFIGEITGQTWYFICRYKETFLVQENSTDSLDNEKLRYLICNKFASCQLRISHGASSQRKDSYHMFYSIIWPIKGIWEYSSKSSTILIALWKN